MYNNKICNSKQISNCHSINVTAVRQMEYAKMISYLCILSFKNKEYHWECKKREKNKSVMALLTEAREKVFYCWRTRGFFSFPNLRRFSPILHQDCANPLI